ncbi:MAG TPA: CHRD domain-containing protein, partial [Nitrososphaeraceae archaeon]|nr:CHRD domain-containing protein [Nitrososphaeraceae archaeon]
MEAQVQGQGIVGFYANLSSNEEVPPNESNATGMAVLLFKNDSSEVSYLVNATGLDEITQSNIYNGSTGMNGEAVVPLSDEKTKIEKKNSSMQYQGQIKTDDLMGTLDGKEIIGLVDLMSNGSAYVNIHTGQYIDGAIRGQIVRGEVQMNGDAITGLIVPGGLVGLSGISIQGGSIIFSSGGIIGFIPILVPSGSQTGGANGNTGGTVGGVVGGVGDGVGGVVGGVGDGV